MSSLSMFATRVGRQCMTSSAVTRNHLASTRVSPFLMRRFQSTTNFLMRRFQSTTTGTTTTTTTTTTNDNDNNSNVDDNSGEKEHYMRFVSEKLEAMLNETKTGTVEYYSRKKCHGSILLDENENDDEDLRVFVHRVNIVSRISPTESLVHPYLRPKERVKFIVARDEDEIRFRASNVTYEDGTHIPIFRDGHVEGAAKHAYRVLGRSVYDILINHVNNQQEGKQSDEEELRAEILQAYKSARTTIQKAETAVLKDQQQQEEQV